MNAGPIAHRYAKALLKLVQETGAGEKVYSQACVLVLRMQEIRQLADALQKRPEIELEKKLQLLTSAMGEPLADELVRFVKLVNESIASVAASRWDDWLQPIRCRSSRLC